MKILLPVDGSDASLDAVRHALQLIREGLRASLVLANVQEQVCSTPSGARAAVIVAIEKIGQNSAPVRVAAVPVPRSRDDWPRVIWQGNSAIDVWIPNLAEELLLLPEAHGIRYRFGFLVAVHQLKLERS